MINWEDFSKVDMRVGTIQRAEFFAEARIPAIKLWIDFGEMGIKKSSAQITHFYDAETLAGKQVIAVLNFPPKQIGPFISECLVLGCVDDEKRVVLLEPGQGVKNGLRIA